MAAMGRVAMDIRVGVGASLFTLPLTMVATGVGGYLQAAERLMLYLPPPVPCMLTQTHIPAS